MILDRIHLFKILKFEFQYAQINPTQQELIRSLP